MEGSSLKSKMSQLKALTTLENMYSMSLVMFIKIEFSLEIAQEIIFLPGNSSGNYFQI